MDIAGGIGAHNHKVGSVELNAQCRGALQHECLSVAGDKCHFRFRYGDALEHRVAIYAVNSVFTILPIYAVFAVFSCGFPKLGPGLAVVCGNIPIALLNLQLRSDAILTILTILAISSILAVNTVLTICSNGFYFLPITI